MSFQKEKLKRNFMEIEGHENWYVETVFQGFHN